MQLTASDMIELESATIIFGIYDPMTGERILVDDGRDHIRLEPGD